MLHVFFLIYIARNRPSETCGFLDWLALLAVSVTSEEPMCIS